MTSLCKCKKRKKIRYYPIYSTLDENLSKMLLYNIIHSTLFRCRKQYILK